MPSLTGLWIKWSGIVNLEPLLDLKRIFALHLGSSTGVTSIDVLGKMATLKQLSLENLKVIKDLSPLSRLSGLKQLGTVGAFPDTVWEVETLEPLGELKSLEYFTMGMLRPNDRSLRPLANLTKLTGSGGPYLCTKCDAAKLSKYVAAYKEAANAP